MRIHTDVLDRREVHLAARTAAARAGHGRIFVVKLEDHGSRTHQYAMEILLEGDGSHNRRKPGHAMVDYSDPNQFAASWESWGWFLAHLFALDPGMKAGGYRDATHFNEVTKGQFETVTA